jgi:hypothetical protein
MKLILGYTLLLSAPLIFATDSKAALTSVPAEYPPNNSSGMSEPVSLSSFSFEVSKDTNRARIVIDYSFRGQQEIESNDRHSPDPSYVQIPALSYDPAVHAVVYNHDGERTICATVKEGRRTKVRSTGNCIVTSVYSDHSEDTGWTIRKVRTLDTFFETH